MKTAIICVTFFIVLFYFAQKCIKMLEKYFDKRVKAQTDDELFKYMLERHGDAWAKSKGLLK